MTANKNMIREKNLERVKQYLFHEQSALKADIAERIGLSVVTVNSLVKQLLEEDIIFEGELVKQSIGRPAVRLHFNYNQCCFLLLSIQEKKASLGKELVILGRIVNMAGEVKYSKETSFKPVDKETFIAIMTSFIDLDPSISKIGISIPGKVYKGVILSSWHDLFNQWSIEKLIKKITDIPLIIENDANLLTVGETINSRLKLEDTTVGIFYPENSMPGITIYHSGVILSGNHNLAGEAKFLPNLINQVETSQGTVLISKLIEIIEIYNAVIAPNQFIISADSVDKEAILKAFKASDTVNRQVNKPKLIFAREFDTLMMKGLLWLILKNFFYEL